MKEFSYFCTRNTNWSRGREEDSTGCTAVKWCHLKERRANPHGWHLSKEQQDSLIQSLDSWIFNSKNQNEFYCVPKTAGHSVESGMGQMLPVSLKSLPNRLLIWQTTEKWHGLGRPEHREKGGKNGGRREKGGKGTKGWWWRERWERERREEVWKGYFVADVVLSERQYKIKHSVFTRSLIPTYKESEARKINHAISMQQSKPTCF